MWALQRHWSCYETRSTSLQRSALEQPGCRPTRTAIGSSGKGGAIEEVLRRSHENVQQKVEAGWDPEGLFSHTSGKPQGLIAARQQSRRKDRLATPPSVAAEDQRVHLASVRNIQSPFGRQHSHRIRPGPEDQSIPRSGPAREALAEHLRQDYVAVNLDQPGLRMLHSDPPIFAVDNFLAPEDCDAFISEADASGLLLPSRIGSGNVSAWGNDANTRRTSCSVLLDGMISLRHPEFKRLMKRVQDAAWRLTDGGVGWGKVGMMPRAGQYCFESPQLARYESGQHFLSHEDGFPASSVTANGFQRHGTVLVYLNDVPQGGATQFEHLHIAVKPRKGMALLFFPSFADGTPDDRTLHTAEEAKDTKWIMQQWIAKGAASNTSADAPQSSRPAPTNVDEAVNRSAQRKPRREKAAQSAARKGF